MNIKMFLNANIDFAINIVRIHLDIEQIYYSKLSLECFSIANDISLNSCLIDCIKKCIL